MQDQDKNKDGGEERSGVDRRSFLGTAGAAAVGALAGLSGRGAKLMAETSRSSPIIEWGPRVDLTGLPDNFAPQTVKDFTVPPGGIDNLGLHSTDVFEIPGVGQFEVDFDGYFRVARSQPSSFQWGVPMIRVNIVELKLFGSHPQLGQIGVSLNPDILASGQIFPVTKSAGSADSSRDDTEAVAACRIAVGAIFNVASQKMVLFNKEPILLMNKSLRRIPPVDDPNGHALLFKLPLFNVDDPHGEPKVFLTSLRYGADNYLTREEVAAIRERTLG